MNVSCHFSKRYSSHINQLEKFPKIYYKTSNIMKRYGIDEVRKI